LDVKKRFSEEQIIGFLGEAEAGIAVKDLCRKHGFSEAFYYHDKLRPLLITSSCRVSRVPDGLLPAPHHAARVLLL
jgi:hypothetical protein